MIARSKAVAVSRVESLLGIQSDIEIARSRKSPAKVPQGLLEAFEKMQKNTVFTGAEARNRTADLLITNPISKVTIKSIVFHFSLFL